MGVKNKSSKKETESSLNKRRKLILHNDEVNTFEHVIDSLCAVCYHDIVQAEQCALITHYNGKCDVKMGSLEFLLPMKEQLIERDLSVTID